MRAIFLRELRGRRFTADGLGGVLAAPAAAANYYVTSNATMATANAGVTPGSIVVIANGTYTTLPSPVTDGTSGSAIVYRAGSGVTYSGSLSISKDFVRYVGGNVTGYRATNSVRIVVRDLDKASSVLDAGIAAGGNAARLGNVAFAIDDDSQLLADARTRAFEDAKNRAEQYADLSGTSLENVVTITEAHDTSGGQTMRAPDASMSDMVLAPGTQQVSFEVTVTWALG